MTEFISIRGARESNLRDVTLQISKRKLTIFTGVSASGRSSIVFGTLATEAQRHLYVDLGPEGGSKGGELVFEGTSAELVKAKRSQTGQYLR
jgi:excinuclease UvrABC ATPase subunit